MSTPLTHFDAAARPMVDVGDKAVTRRVAWPAAASA
jgi:molybdenum cofactor biosynthesis enzyme